jgi:hypothetical protein
MLEVSQYPTSLYYKAIAIKTVWHCHKNRYEDQWKGIEYADMNHHCYAHLVFDKAPKTYAGEKTVSSTNVVGTSDYLPTEN